MNVIYPAIRSAVYPAVRGALDISEKKQTSEQPSEQIIQSLFDQGQQGFWLPFTDFASLSQDSAGTLPYTAVQQPVGRVLDRSGRGNHASQVTSTARGVVSARVNLATNTGLAGAVAGTPGIPPTGWFNGSTTSTLAVSSRGLVFSSVAPGRRSIRLPTPVQNGDILILRAMASVVDNTQIQNIIGSTTAGIASVAFALDGVSVAASFPVPSGGDHLIEAAITYNRAMTAQPTIGIGVPNNATGIVEIWNPEIFLNVAPALPYQRVTTATDYDSVGFPKFLTFDGVDDRLQATLPAITGTWIVGYKEGTLVYKVAIPAGAFPIGTNTNASFHTPSKNFAGMVLRAGDLTEVEVSAVESYLVANGAGAAGVDAFAGVGSFSSAWFGCTSLTSFPLINTAAGTSFSSAWFGCTSLTSFPLINTAAGTNFSEAWANCTSLTSFPTINTGAGTNFQSAWYNCSSLTSFPLINTGAGTNFISTWYGCSSLTSFPLINTGAGTNFDSTWQSCTSLTSFPLINTAAGTSFSSAWYGCSSLTSFPLINTAAGTNFYAAWQNCSSLTSFPLINTGAGTNFYAAWKGCTSLTSFPLINTVAGTSFSYAWYDCTSLTSFPTINTANGTNFNTAWAHCTSLTSFPLINTAAGTNFVNAWNGCTSLTSFPLINTAAGTNFQAAWYGCASLTSFPSNMFDSCQATNFIAAFLDCALSQASVDGILASLVTAGKSNGTLHMHGGTSSTPSAAGLASKATLVSRGWTVTHN